MFTCNFDESAATLVCRYTTPYEPADYVAYHTEFVRFISAARAQRRRAVLIIDIQDGYPQPNAVQRKNIGEAWAKAPEVPAAIAIITGSALIRGIITAIEWFSKNSTSRRETRAYARTADAVTWLSEQSAADASRLTAAIEKARTSSYRPVAQAHP